MAEEKEKEGKKGETEKGKSELEKKDEEIEELTDSLQRLQAEFENYKKQVEKEKKKFEEYSNAELISKLLPVLDNFEMALKNKDSKNKDKIIDGMEMIFAEIYSILEKQGLKPINAVGEKFDPYYHEALMKEESDKDDIVLEELQKGYLLKDRVLRSSKVKVGVKEEN